MIKNKRDILKLSNGAGLVKHVEASQNVANLVDIAAQIALQANLGDKFFFSLVQNAYDNRVSEEKAYKLELDRLAEKLAGEER